MIGMEDKFVLELGYELLSLVDRDNHLELLDGILNLRKQKPYIPKIRIMDNITLEPFEISLNKERSILNKEENLTSQILTIIKNFVEKELSDGTLVEIPLETPIPPREVGFVYRSNSKSLQRFIDFYKRRLFKGTAYTCKGESRFKLLG